MVNISGYSEEASAYHTGVDIDAHVVYTLDQVPDAPTVATVTIADPTGLYCRILARDGMDAVAGAVADDGGAETDETTEANNAAANDMTLLPAAPVDDDAYYFGFDDSSIISFTLNVTTGGDATIPWTGVWEYSTGSDTWATGPIGAFGFNDGTGLFFNEGINTVSWSPLTDWATDSVGGVAGKYWVRFRVDMLGAAGYVQPKGGQAWAGAQYAGAGRIQIEDPDETTIFDGRIQRVTWNSNTRETTLHCEDWLSQLNDEQITYDMREDLDGSGTRESKLRSDVDGAFIGAVQNDGGSYYLFDDGEYDDDGGMGWVNDQWNGYYFVISDKIAGKHTWTFHPYTGITTDKDNTITGAVENVWLLNGNVNDSSDNTPADFETTYSFRCELGHDTPSNFYVNGSISKLQVTCRMQVGDSANNGICTVKVKGPVADHTLAVISYTADFKTYTWEMDVDDLDDAVQADGELDIEFDCDEGGGGGSLTLGISYLEVQIECTTTGYSTATAITDTVAPNRLETATDFTAAATQLWEKVPYSIADLIHHHIESATGLVLGYDSMVTLTCAGGDVEETSGISTRQYVDFTPLEILKDLATQDKAHFWIPLGGTTVKWESTQGADTVQLTDADYNYISIDADSTKIVNEVKAFGMRIGDQRLESTYTDTTSEDTYNFTRTKVVSGMGLVSEYDTLARATAEVNRYKDMKKMLTVMLEGNTALAAHAKTLKLMDVVAITSTVLGLSDVDYVVQRFFYDSERHETLLTLHPKASTVGMTKPDMEPAPLMWQNARRGDPEKYIPDNVTDEVS